MIRSVEFELYTVSEANSRENWRVGANRHAEQREAVRGVLNKYFGAPPAFSVMLAGWTRPNEITITLTRIAPGLLDKEDNLPGALKYVKDEIASWFGVKDNDARLVWELPYKQERAAADVYKVKIEIADLTPGEDIRVALASEPETLGQRARPLVKYTKKKHPLPAPTDRRCFAALPWEQPPCNTCGGDKCAGPLACEVCHGSGRERLRLKELHRYRGQEAPPPWIDYHAPKGHAHKYPKGRARLYRREFRSKLGAHWLFEERVM